MSIPETPPLQDPADMNGGFAADRIDDERDTTPSIGEVLSGPQPERTVADILREGYNRAAANRKPKDITIPGYGEPDSELHVTFRMVDDYEELRKGIARALNQRSLRPAQREVHMGMQTLLAAAEGSYAIVNGKRHDIGHPLGLALYDALGAPGATGDVRPQNDQQAVFMLFHQSTTVLMTAFAELDQWMKRGGQEAEEEALGESLAAISPLTVS